ncbi:hypothetical protein J1N10_03815 [Carboxylicivirga sp. A043]|uniref:hypothetical protein n=1 Tax=Carboxylicivirga litoralis TaxID=2816963 RepID=UPI0021CB08D4|nr:hypothetical protein [Carboxylicivirga sp. A043]MCU4155087.1 hypothetical protein [Carboxylicivirga sp. A043]
MATDGPKIIDGDTAHDTYWGIMDLYDNEVDLEKIKEEFPFDVDYDDFDYENYLTSLALAFWEIGLMNDSLLKKVSNTIAKGVGVKVWTEECDKKTGRQRELALNRLIKKISVENVKIRKPKKKRKVTNFHFQPDDLLTFKLNDGQYRAVICTKITQQRGLCTYDLVGTTYKGEFKPDSKVIEDYAVCGRWISSGFYRNEIIEMQTDIDKLWEKIPNSSNRFLGLSYHLVTHKAFYGFKEKFEKVGVVKLKESYKRDGSYGYESTFDRFEEIFGDIQNHMQIFGEKCIPIVHLIDDGA